MRPPENLDWQIGTDDVTGKSERSCWCRLDALTPALDCASVFFQEASSNVLKLYHCWSSVFAQKSRIVLAGKQLPRESTHLDLFEIRSTGDKPRVDDTLSKHVRKDLRP
jgi:hypothetical protein